MAQKRAQTIGDLHSFMQKNMATKTELAGLQKDMSATKKQVDLVARNMATKEELGEIKKVMATKNDIGLLSSRMNNSERDYVKNNIFAKFRDETITRLDIIIGKLDKDNQEEVAEQGGLARVSDDLEKHDMRITANRQDINQINTHLKTA